MRIHATSNTRAAHNQSCAAALPLQSKTAALQRRMSHPHSARGWALLSGCRKQYAAASRECTRAAVPEPHSSQARTTVRQRVRPSHCSERLTKRIDECSRAPACCIAGAYRLAQPLAGRRRLSAISSHATPSVADYGSLPVVAIRNKRLCEPPAVCERTNTNSRSPCLSSAQQQQQATHAPSPLHARDTRLHTHACMHKRRRSGGRARNSTHRIGRPGAAPW